MAPSPIKLFPDIFLQVIAKYDKSYYNNDIYTYDTDLPAIFLRLTVFTK